MIFQRAAGKEFAQTAAAVFVALFAILLTTQLIRLLGDAAGGEITSESVVALLGFAALNYLPVLLSLTLFVAVLLSLSRVYRDAEMVVWFSAGVPLTAWLRPVLKFALPLVTAIAALSLLLSPWALGKSAEYRKRLEQRDDSARVAPGAFNESASSGRVFFVEGVGNDATRVKNVFVSSLTEGKLGVMVAAAGHIEFMPNGDKFMVLENGRRYEGQPGAPNYRVMEFDRYAMRVETREARGADDSPRTLSTAELFSKPSPSNQGELLWRIGIPLTALNLVLLAIPLSLVNPRGGRAHNLLFALLSYITYYNLLNLSQAWVVQGKLGFVVGVVAVHLGVFLFLLALFSQRIHALRWSRLLHLHWLKPT